MMNEIPDIPIERYISVDVETSGPSPGKYALLSIGACTMEEPRHTFYVELQPDTTEFTQDAMLVSQLSFDRLGLEGLPPKVAMEKFERWLDEVMIEDAQPVFTALNAPFDWMFVNEYFYRYLGYNPFGYKALDIKAFFMGLHGVLWQDTSYATISEHYSVRIQLTHHALHDAISQADIFQGMLIDFKDRRRDVDDQQR
jgi:DNA polymerase III epsilon subunit-like protein